MYNKSVANAVLLVSSVATLFCFFELGRHVFNLCTSRPSLIPVFLVGFSCVPHFVYNIRIILLYSYSHVKGIFSRNKLNLMREHEHPGVVLPSDLDICVHMNNSRYQREMDFSRLQWFCDTGLSQYCMSRNRHFFVVGCFARYRKSLEVYQRFNLKTKVIYWDNHHLYLQNQFTRKDKEGKEFIHALFITQLKWHSKETVDEMLCDFLETKQPPQRPPFPEELQHLTDYIDKSKQTLRRLR